MPGGQRVAGGGEAVGQAGADQGPGRSEAGVERDQRLAALVQRHGGDPGVGEQDRHGSTLGAAGCRPPPPEVPENWPQVPRC